MIVYVGLKYSTLWIDLNWKKSILAENTMYAWSCGLNFCPVEEENPEFWRSQARETLQSALNRKINTNVAKNVVLFLGDGELTWLTRPWGIVVRLLLWLHLPRRPTHTHTHTPATTHTNIPWSKKNLFSCHNIRNGNHHLDGSSNPEGTTAEPDRGGDSDDHGHVP